RYANDGVQELALQDRPALSFEAQPDEEGRHRVEIFDRDTDVIEAPDRRHGVHPPVFVRQVRFSLLRLPAEPARSRPGDAGKATAQPPQSGASYAVSESGVWAMRVARICASCRCSSAVRASPRALAMNRSSTAQHRLRQLASPGKRPINLGPHE